jgi:hypothetical protein
MKIVIDSLNVEEELPEVRTETGKVITDVLVKEVQKAYPDYYYFKIGILHAVNTYHKIELEYYLKRQKERCEYIKNVMNYLNEEAKKNYYHECVRLECVSKTSVFAVMEMEELKAISESFLRKKENRV